MDALLQFGLDASHWLQSTLPQMDAFFKFISTLGLEEFYLALMPLIYWSVNKEMGRALAYVFLLSNVFNNMLKHAFREPRPFWLDPTLERFTDFGYGMPSGHTQFTTTIYLFLAIWIRRRWMWLLATALIILMPLSRVYLGSHFVQDVAVGFLLGLLVLGGYYFWERRYMTGFSKRILGQRLLTAVAVPVGLTAVYLIIRLIIGEPDTTVAWASYIPVAELESLEGMVTAVATVLGAGIGLVLERTRIRFLVDGPIWQRAVRYLLGIVVAGVIWAGLGQVFPDEPLWLALPLRLLRYTLLTLWVTYYAPWVFVKLKLAQAKPDPGIEMTL
ncbi:MAG: phosphatase PAP2 family protein [Ardenticatenaceae bacterium]|nr:phosphatase PAP2 family protein [Ardenticatenaceae bacterium]MCB8950184.1 phosphatase PAP2 family protein [Ardenticatenaceae bacterium]